MWCVKHLGLKENQVRWKASHLGLRLDTKGAFYLKAVEKRSRAVTGRKRPEHSRLMKIYAKENRVLRQRHEIRKLIKVTCTSCGLVFYPYHTHGKNHPSIRCCSKECAGARQKNKWKDRNHPRGMHGKKHTEKTKSKMSVAYKKAWSDADAKYHTDTFRQGISDRNTKAHAEKTFYNDTSNPYSRCKAGWFQGGGKRYYMRSKWEHNYAWYLEWLKGRREIKDWEYEVDTFWFEAIRRGVRSYTPDFKVYTPANDIEYHEVKGWMDAKSKTKLKRMAKYHPDITMVLVDSDVYKSIGKWGRLIPGWE